MERGEGCKCRIILFLDHILSNIFNNSKVGPIWTETLV